MEFLVEIQVDLPPDFDEKRRAALLEAEREKGLEYRRAGTIRRIWRVPGRVANVGVWEAPDATSLHASISALPLFPWMDVRVTALATHYLEQE